MLRRLVPILCLVVLALPLRAQTVDALFDQLRLSEMIEVMREEGLDYGRELGTDMFAGGSNPQWTAILDRIYDTGRMEALVRARFDASLTGTDIAPLSDFFTTETGQEIVALELGARQAMIDSATEEAARQTFRERENQDGTRMEQVTAFVEANDLIETNVAGALNASYRFYAGLVEGGGLEMSESEILADVWSQEEDTRGDTREWLFAYLLMAYEPLSDDQMAAYLDLARSPEGQALNRALFDAFNRMYDDISYALGLATAQQMQGQDL
ncbi:DUF2059 domain-containing protein [Thetidibacter halocola]|uniref:DUF2059 domain-containing protein n=1 Tax=Thetidibacter halocola TaxID=2827239 RepID=A0A8J7W7V8_9RHOB|nr:DUF2059 domain-containing protein [Thetidibacter halocola]MBS0122527.1 DUF2059 domain-containing protein [Thetidibacter halocola]